MYKFIGKKNQCYILDIIKHNMNNCHNPPGPGGGQFCEGGGSGSSSGGSYTPLNREGYVPAGTFPAHKVGNIASSSGRIDIESKKAYMQNIIDTKLKQADEEKDIVKATNLRREAFLMQKSLKKSIADNLRHSRNKQATEFYKKNT